MFDGCSIRSETTDCYAFDMPMAYGVTRKELSKNCYRRSLTANKYQSNVLIYSTVHGHTLPANTLLVDITLGSRRIANYHDPARGKILRDRSVG